MNQISDYAVISDCHSLALVGRDGSIDWACFPRFDSPSVFARALDLRKGGSFSVTDENSTTTEREYLPDTNVLVTRFVSESGVLEVTDCMPVLCDDVTDARRIIARHSIVRRVRCISGRALATVRIEPRFEYAMIKPLVLVHDDDLELVGGATSMWVRATRALGGTDGAVTATWDLMQGEEVWLEATWRPSHDRPSRSSGTTNKALAAELSDRLEATIDFWREWAALGRYEGENVEMVRRSALVLKGLSYAPTGAVIAAGTTSLPEWIGGVRNWDYRYTWIRDATLTLTSLLVLGHQSEATSFRQWIARTSAGRPDDLQIMYGIGGERMLTEVELGHLEGHQGSAPVRIGNGAATQVQLDCYGQILDSALLYLRAGGQISQPEWLFLAGLAEKVTKVWKRPDQGIWEIRGEPRHFVHSKLSCWMALDRAIRIADDTGFSAPVKRWTETREEIRGYLEGEADRLGYFPQAVGLDAPDASTLLIPALGFLPTTDPRVVATIDKVMEELTEDGLVHRYHADDGVGGEEGAFLMCSFWLTDCLIHLGRLDEAGALVEQLLSYANDVGLFAEEVHPETSDQLGNFPQAFTHMALVMTCTHYSAALAGNVPGDEAIVYAEVALERLMAERGEKLPEEPDLG